MTIIVRSTRNCPNTPRILFALEELGLEYEMEHVEDGVFSRDWGSPGPSITDAETTTIEPGAILRHLSRRTNGKLWPVSLAQQADADRWLEFQGRRISRAVDAKDGPEIIRLLGFVEAQLGRSKYLVGDELTMVDIYYSLLALPAARERMPFLRAMPAVSAYLDRIGSRPAFERANAVAARI